MTCLTTAATPLVHSVDPTTGIVFGTFLGFSSAALLIIGESARRTVGIVYLNENKDKVNSPLKDAGWEKYAEFKIWFDKRLDAAIKKVEEEEQTEEQEVHRQSYV